MSPASDLVCFGWLLSYRNWVISDWVACGHSINEPCSQCILGRDDGDWWVIAGGSRHARFVTKMRSPPQSRLLYDRASRTSCSLLVKWLSLQNKYKTIKLWRITSEEHHKSDSVWKATTQLIWMHCQINASIVLMEVWGGWMAPLSLLTLVSVSHGL